MTLRDVAELWDRLAALRVEYRSALREQKWVQCQLAEDRLGLLGELLGVEMTVAGLNAVISL